MPSDNLKTNTTLADRLISAFLGLSLREILPALVKSTRYFWERRTYSGIYEVLDYESNLELLDKDGYRAFYSKREEVCYLQKNIIVYQDQVWRAGQILIMSHCSPGKVMDRYRPGKKTYLLISLREIRNRNDVERFNTEWRIREGFTQNRAMGN